MNSLYLKSLVGVLVVGSLTMTGSVSAQGHVVCPDYTDKVVKTGQEHWLVAGGYRWRLVDREAAATWDKPVYSAKSGCVETVPDMGGMLSFRAGTRLLKQAGHDAIFATGPNGAIHLIDSPEVAAYWYGPKWGALVRTVSVDLFAKYRLAEPLTMDTLPNGTIVRAQAQAWPFYLVRDGQLVKITGRVRYAVSQNAVVLSSGAFKKMPLSSTTVEATEVLKMNIPVLAPTTAN